MLNRYCPVCANVCILQKSNLNEVLIIGDFPTDEDIRQGKLFSTNPNFITPGKVLKKELEMVGLSINDFAIMNLWMHKPNNDERCFQLGYDNILDEAKGKKAILLLGADVVETFTSYKVSDVSGLRVESSLLSAPLIVASVSPSLALARTIGEVRFAIGQWKKYLEMKNLI